MHEYDFVLEAFKASRGGLSSDRLAEELRALQPSVKELRVAYRRSAKDVQPEYVGAIADAYLLAYFPTYIRQSRIMYEKAAVEFSPHMKVGVFCGGPCPEIVGLLDYFKSKNSDSLPDDLHIEFYLFEPNLAGWKEVFDGVLEAATERFGENRFSCHSSIFNLLKQREVEGHESIIRNLDIATFQNFDNEMGAVEKNIMRENIQGVADLLPQGSKLLMSDLFYSSASHEILETHLGENFSTTVEKCLDSPAFLRDEHLIHRHLLRRRDGLWERRRAGPISCLTAKKKQSVPQFVSPPQETSTLGNEVPQGRQSLTRLTRGEIIEGLVVEELPAARGVVMEVGAKKVIITSDDLEIEHPLPTGTYVGRKITAEVTSEIAPYKASRRNYLSKEIGSIKRGILSSKKVVGVFVASNPDGSLEVKVHGLPGIVPQDEVIESEESLKLEPNEEIPLVVLSKSGSHNKLSYSWKRAVNRGEP